jgi:hypothetical protein
VLTSECVPSQLQPADVLVNGRALRPAVHQRHQGQRTGYPVPGPDRRGLLGCAVLRAPLKKMRCARGGDLPEWQQVATSKLFPLARGRPDWRVRSGWCWSIGREKNSALLLTNRTCDDHLCAWPCLRVNSVTRTLRSHTRVSSWWTTDASARHARPPVVAGARRHQPRGGVPVHRSHHGGVPAQLLHGVHVGHLCGRAVEAGIVTEPHDTIARCRPSPRRCTQRAAMAGQR